MKTHVPQKAKGRANVVVLRHPMEKVNVVLVLKEKGKARVNLLDLDLGLELTFVSLGGHENQLLLPIGDHEEVSLIINTFPRKLAWNPEVNRLLVKKTDHHALLFCKVSVTKRDVEIGI